MSINQHESTCMLNDTNLKKAVEFFVAFIEAKASYRRQLPIPSNQRIEAFCRRSSIEPFVVFKNRVCDGMDTESIIDFLFFIAIDRQVADEHTIPPHIKFLFDATQYLTPDAFEDASAKFNKLEMELTERMAQHEIRSRKYRQALESGAVNGTGSPRRKAWRKVQ